MGEKERCLCSEAPYYFVKCKQKMWKLQSSDQIETKSPLASWLCVHHTLLWNIRHKMTVFGSMIWKMAWKEHVKKIWYLTPDELESQSEVLKHTSGKGFWCSIIWGFTRTWVKPWRWWHLKRTTCPSVSPLVKSVKGKKPGGSRRAQQEKYSHN